MYQYKENHKQQCTLQNDGKVDDGSFRGDLWRVVRVAELGRYVEPEIVVVLDLLVAKPEYWHTSCAEIPAEYQRWEDLKHCLISRQSQNSVFTVLVFLLSFLSLLHY